MTKDEIIKKWIERTQDMYALVVEIPVKSVAKERPRSARNGHFYTPKKTADYEKTIADHVKKFTGSPWTSFVKIKLVFVEAMPKGWSDDKKLLAQHRLILPTKGDLDNKVKAVTDALNGVVYLDDAQIAHIRASRFYGTTDLVWIELTPIALGPQQIEQALYSMKNAKADKWRQTSS